MPYFHMKLSERIEMYEDQIGRLSSVQLEAENTQFFGLADKIEEAIQLLLNRKNKLMNMNPEV